MKQKICDLLEDFRKGAQPRNPQKPVFKGVEGYDVYNPSVPFRYKNKELIIARVEKRDSEDSLAVFFEKNGGVFEKRSDLPQLELQDPCISKIGDRWIVGGTAVIKKDGKVSWYTQFFKGKDLENLTPFLDAPEGMKDVRLLELPDGRIAVCSRPQGKKGGRGSIGFGIADNLDAVTREFIDELPILEQFIPEEWGGANQLVLAAPDTIGIIGHIANFSEGTIRHYYAMAFTLNIHTQKASPIRIIAERRNFLPGQAKRPDLEDVLFSAGIVEKDDTNVILYVGVSDCEVQSVQIKNPF